MPAAAWRTRPTATVLKLLAHERGRAVSVDRLIDAVWPERDPEAARNSLHGAVRTIRGVLEPERASGAASRYLVRDGDGYRLLAEACATDVDAFEAARHRASAAETAGDRAQALAAYREAVALHRGEYLADDPYDDWALGARERLTSGLVAALEALGRLLTEIGDADQAIGYLERILTLDPLHEPTYRALMSAHAAAGRRSHALAVYERCAQRLRAEIGVAPMEETERLRASVAAGVPRPGPAAAAHRDATPPPTSEGELHVPFVGRDRELAALRRVWGLSAVEGGHLIAIRGPAGVGKSRLLRHALARLEPPARAVWIAAHEAEAGVPFAPLVGLVADWLERGANAAQLHRLGGSAAALAHLIPQLAGGRSVAAPPPEPGQLLEAFTAAVRLVAGSGRIALVLDDAQWSDGGTLAWLGYVQRRLGPGALAALTCRDDGVPEPLRAVLAAAERAERLTRVDLVALSSGEVDGLLDQLVRSPAEARPLARRLYRSTAGHPLFVVATLRELVCRGQLFPGPQGGWRAAAPPGEADLPLPSSLRETLDARIAALPAADREVLAALAVLGTPGRAELLARAVGRPEEALLPALERLLQRGLVRVEGHGYTVDHPLIRRAVQDGLAKAERRRWHRRVARALVVDPTHPAGALLHHLVAAGAPAGETARIGAAAAAEALRHHAYPEAIELYRATIERAGAARAGQGLVAELAEGLGEALAAAGRWDEAIATFEGLLAGSDDPLRASRIRRRLAQVLGDVRAAFDEAGELLDAAEAELASRSDEPAEVERGRVQGARSVIAFYRGGYAAAIEASRRALDLWRGRPGTDADAMEQMHRIGLAEQRLGRLDRAEAAFRRALGRARMGHDRLAEARFQGTLAALIQHRGQLRLAAELLDEALATFRDLGVPKFEAITLTNLGVVRLELGDLAAARAAYERAIELAERLDARYTVMHALVGLGEVLAHADEPTAARAALDRGIALAEAIGNRQRLAHAQLHLAELALRRGDAAAARDLAERGLASGQAIGDAHTRREGAHVLARALRDLALAEAAAEEARAGLEAARRGGFVLAEARNLSALGQALAAQGRSREADESLEAAEGIFQLAGADRQRAAVRRVREAAGHLSRI